VTPGVEAPGPLTRRVVEYDQAMRALVPAVESAGDWAPLTEFVAVDDFERVGTFLEVQDWQQDTEMLTRWAAATDSFETTVRRISEVGDLVYYEIEERHHRGGHVHVVRSLTVFHFNEAHEITHLAVYLQQPR
jgi:hypothetical protein